MSKRQIAAGAKIIRVDDEVYDVTLRAKHRLELAEARIVTMGEAVAFLVDEDWCAGAPRDVPQIAGQGTNLIRGLTVSLEQDESQGIGFGKNLDHNLELLRSLPTLGSLGRPLLVGPSRKTFIGMVLQVGPEDRLEGSIAAAVAAALGGANMIRVHDVRSTFRALRVADKIRFGATIQ